MIKRLLFFVLILLFISCNTTKPVVQTTKSVRVLPNTTVKTIKKTVSAKPVAAKTESKVIIETPTVDKPAEKTASKTVVLEATTRVKVTTEIVLNYISKFKEIAKNNMAQFGIPSSIILAQGILESGAGTGPLSTTANNHFGIKCHKEWKGPSVKHDDDSAQECFRKYEMPNESYKDHALFLTSRPWYAGLFKLKKDDYKAWARGLKSAGYATDPKYPEKLIGIIERYQLNRYDAEVLGMNYASVNDLVADNNPKGYQVMQGDTMYSISKKFNLSVEELKRKNNMSDNALTIGQNLKVE